jgi:sortase B
MRKAIRIVDSAVNTAALILILLLISIGGYALWDSGLVNASADAARYEKYKPDAGDGSLSFAELQTINPEVIAWLCVYGTHIDYPVAQSPDDMKYVNTDAEGNYSLTGAIFLDSGAASDFSDFNSILYGHHMEKKAMFGEIGRFAEQDWFDARRYGSLYCGGVEHGLEFFAFLRADAYDSTVFRSGVTGEGARTYLDTLLGRALHTREVNVGMDDRIVLLSTCSSDDTNGRDILVGRVTDERYPDTFRRAERAGDIDSPKVDGTSNLYTRMLAAAAMALLLLIVLLTIVRRRRKAGDGSAVAMEHPVKGEGSAAET